ncbi:MAG TPA: two-component system response regulator [Blastocatellia bacterium]|nr:two-component system response regulator [Blastocatellia bacterium]
MSTSSESKRSILLVEDDANDIELTKRAFERNRLANVFLVARDGAEALEMLFGSSVEAMHADLSELQLILLDLKLPKVSGLEVLRKIRADERTRMIPVVVLKSSDEERDVVESYGLGANSYVRKPIDFEQFVEAVRELGLYWLVLNKTVKRD